MDHSHKPVKQLRVFTVIAMALLMMAIDSTIVATALRAIQHGLQASVNLAGWTITAYSFGFVLMLPISGKLSERFGRRRVFIGSTVAFTMASLGCGLADNIYLLIVLRVLQAAGGAGFTPSATGIIVDHFGSSRDRYVSLFGSIFPVGAMIGPIFGGFFVTWLSWRDVFYVNVPIGLLILFLAWRYLPHDRPRGNKRRRKMDLPGIVLLGGGLLAGMLSISALGELRSGAGWAWSMALLLLACLAFLTFFRHIQRAQAPFIVPRLIYGEGFGAVNLVNMIFTGSIVGAMALVPLYAVNRYGISAVGSGSLLTAQGAAAMICSLLAVMLLRRSGYRLPLYVGSVLSVAGLLLLALPPQWGISPYAWLAFAAFLVGAGNGSINPATRNAGLQLAPESSAMLAALRTLSLQIGSIVTVSIVTAILVGNEHQGLVQAWVYAFLALLRIVALPLIRSVPEQRGAW
ncbi:MFS transporter [Candidimonas nitroreducens]|nr:MFS transporter [Candidimonas nitroreducens]